jgi:hypothetical protein
MVYVIKIIRDWKFKCERGRGCMCTNRDRKINILHRPEESGRREDVSVCPVPERYANSPHASP